MYQNLPISRKLLAPGLLGLIILTAASTLFWTNRLENSLETAFEEKISLTEVFISPPLTEALWDFNEGLVQSSLAGLENYDAFVFAIVFSDGSEFARFSPRSDWQENWDEIIQTLREDPDLNRIEFGEMVFVLTNLVREDQQMGELVWGFNRAQMVAANQSAMNTALSIGAGSFVAFAILLFFISRSVAGPIRMVVDKIEKLQSGEKDFEIQEANRKDEVGQLGKALKSFRESLTEAERLAAEQKEREAEQIEHERKQELAEREAEQVRLKEAQALQEEETRRIEAERQAERGRQREKDLQQKEQAQVVETLGSALTRMSNGDLGCTIKMQFSEGYETLRKDFNEAVERLSSVIGSSLSMSVSVLQDTSSISEAAKGLSQRSERQASTLGQTASALHELTSAVQSSASDANEARSLVKAASKRAKDGESVVTKTVSAMSDIETSSAEIARITSVIEQIAFQTNLLALNAGVEAARAGDAGHGFAVVAAEVRALAGRSQEAAGEINDIISTSSETVAKGAALVQESGESLSEILASISEISTKVEKIASRSSELSDGITEINSSVADLDQTTQDNVAMFEETTAAIASLSTEAARLKSEMSQFSVSDAERSDQENDVLSKAS